MYVCMRIAEYMSYLTQLPHSSLDAQVDAQGRQWGADRFFSGGMTYVNVAAPIDNTFDDIIYQGERYGLFSYSIPVPLGTLTCWL
jgi:Malectin domain